VDYRLDSGRHDGELCGDAVQKHAGLDQHDAAWFPTRVKGTLINAIRDVITRTPRHRGYPNTRTVHKSSVGKQTCLGYRLVCLPTPPSYAG